MIRRVCIVSGGNSGIGFELCRGMADAGFHVVMVSRGAERGQPALEKLQAESSKTIGIISHVDSLKERIATQVILSRNGQGYSSISVKG